MCAAITTAAIGGGLSLFQAYQGHEQQRKAKNALQNYNRQNLEDSNAFKSIPISTVGSDIMREDNQLASANAIDAARNMGTRGAAMLPGIVAANNRSNNETRAYLDDQINRRNYAIAGDEQNIRSLQEERENADLAGIGNQMQVGQQNMWSGFRGMASSAMYAANNIDWSKDGSGSQADKDLAKMGGIGMSGDAFYNRYKSNRYDSMLNSFNPIK